MRTYPLNVRLRPLSDTYVTPEEQGQGNGLAIEKRVSYARRP
jgi:hypothetical protein